MECEILGTMYRYTGFCYEDWTFQIIADRYAVIKRTEKGVWVVPFYSHFYVSHDKLFVPSYVKRRWVANEGRKRFCHETLEMAMKSFRHRKEKQVRILKYQLLEATKGLKISTAICESEDYKERYTEHEAIFDMATE